MDTPFDRWVQEAPARHTGVFALLVLALVAVLTSLASCADKGQCLETVTIEHQNYDEFGAHPSTSTECIKWEFPNGRPKQPK